MTVRPDETAAANALAMVAFGELVVRPLLALFPEGDANTVLAEAKSMLKLVELDAVPPPVSVAVTLRV